MSLEQPPRFKKPTSAEEDARKSSKETMDVDLDLIKKMSDEIEEAERQRSKDGKDLSYDESALDTNVYPISQDPRQPHTYKPASEKQRLLTEQELHARYDFKNKFGIKSPELGAISRELRKETDRNRNKEGFTAEGFYDLGENDQERALGKVPERYARDGKTNSEAENTAARINREAAEKEAAKAQDQGVANILSDDVIKPIKQELKGAYDQRLRMISGNHAGVGIESVAAEMAHNKKELPKKIKEGMISKMKETPEYIQAVAEEDAEAIKKMTSNAEARAKTLFEKHKDDPTITTFEKAVEESARSKAVFRKKGEEFRDIKNPLEKIWKAPARFVDTLFGSGYVAANDYLNARNASLVNTVENSKSPVWKVPFARAAAVKGIKGVGALRNSIPFILVGAGLTLSFALDWGLNKLSKKAEEWKSISLKKAWKDNMNFSKMNIF
jgi:hypothetical protein